MIQILVKNCKEIFLKTEHATNVLKYGSQDHLVSFYTFKNSGCP